MVILVRHLAILVVKNLGNQLIGNLLNHSSDKNKQKTIFCLIDHSYNCLNKI